MTNHLTAVVERIIAEGTQLRDKYVRGVPMRIDYVAVFCQNEAEFRRFNEDAISAGGLVRQETPTGSVYYYSGFFPAVEPGTKLLKIRTVDPTRPQRGDVDFWIFDFHERRLNLIRDLPVRDIVRSDGELIELADEEFDVLVYFSNPPLSRDLAVEY